MYKIEVELSSAQKGFVYVVASSQREAIIRVRRYFRRQGQNVTIGLIHFQFTDMFIELN